MIDLCVGSMALSSSSSSSSSFPSSGEEVSGRECDEGCEVLLC